MRNYTVYILDITHAGSTNGVDRHISNVLAGLAASPLQGRIYHIRFVLSSRRMALRRDDQPGYTQITIPLPEQFGTVISQVYWSGKYNEAVYGMIEPCFRKEKNPVIHLHTLNLIDLALQIRKHTGAKIITHLHCIPWKNLYGEHPSVFNRLYERYYSDQNDQSSYYTGHSEEVAYKRCDRLIACTGCGRDFVRNVARVAPEKISLLPNGLNDFSPRPVRRDTRFNRPVRLLFAGWVSEGKGIFFVLEALRLVRAAGYDAELYVAGTGQDTRLEYLRQHYSDIPVRMLGILPFEQLQEYYRCCDIGVIGSLQEQNSYVAIEMCMFGMPVVTTAVEGLDEMFTDREDALKVPVTFDLLTGLQVDVVRMRDALVELILSPELRNRLSEGARRLYEQKHTLPRMTGSLLNIYDSMNMS